MLGTPRGFAVEFFTIADYPLDPLSLILICFYRTRVLWKDYMAMFSLGVSGTCLKGVDLFKGCGLCKGWRKRRASGKT